jgi:hypothetical protein
LAALVGAPPPQPASVDNLDRAVRERLLFALPSGEGPQAAFMGQL